MINIQKAIKAYLGKAGKDYIGYGSYLTFEFRF